MYYKNYSTTNIILWLICLFALLLTIIFMFFTCSNKKMGMGKDRVQNLLSDTISISGKREFNMLIISDSISYPEQW